MEIFWVWLAFAAVNMVIANAKGRSEIGWGLLGLLFSFFSTIVLVALPSQKVEKTYVQVGDKWVNAATVKPETKNCPDCGESVLKVANVCKHCGFRFAASPGEVPTEKRDRPY